jgi:guanylate kinase
MNDESMESRAEGKSSPLLIVISAPSGGGKTTLCQQLLTTNPNVTRVVTCTTRPPREGEQDGVDYYFLDEATFQRRVQADEFLEFATVYGHRYGNTKSEVLARLRQGRDVLLSVDVQGVAALRARAAADTELKRSLITAFLTPASIAILERRLRKRGTDSDAVVRKRLSVARKEIAQWKQFDYLIISTTIAEDLRRMECILEAEKMRPCRAQPPEV